MNRLELQKRTQQFGIRVIRLVDSLPKAKSAGVIGKQLLRSATAVGANYRSACRGRSRADFISKFGIALEEADETLYWMELLVDSGLVSRNRIVNLIDEANQIVSILAASSKTVRSNSKIVNLKS